MSARLAALALTSALAAACGAPAAAPAAPDPAPRPPTSALAPPAPPAANASASAAPAPVPAPLPSIPMHLVADGFAGPVSFHPMSGATLVTAPGFAGLIEGDGLVPHPEWVTAPGSPFEHDGLVIGGRWPDSAWLAVTKDESLVKWTLELWRFREGKWVKARGDEKNGPPFLGILALPSGSVIAVRTDPRADEMLLDTLSGKRTKLLGMASIEERCRDPRGDCRGRGPRSEAASGRVIATSRMLRALARARHGSGRDLQQFEWDLDGGGAGTGAPAPWPWPLGARVEPVGIVVTGGGDFAVAAIGEAKDGPPVLALQRWTIPNSSPWPERGELPSPPHGHLKTLAGADDGTVCMTTDRARDARDSAHAFCSARGSKTLTALSFPDEVTARELWTRGMGEVWAAAMSEETSRHEVYRSSRPASVLHVAASGRPERDDRRAFLPPPDGSRECERNFVLAYSGAPPSAASRADILAALAGPSNDGAAEVVEGEERGRAYLGAVVEKYAAGQRLVEALRRVSGATPKVLCFAPESKREAVETHAIGGAATRP